MELQEMPSVSGAKGEDLEASKALQEVKGDDKENLDKKTQGLKGMQTDHYSKLQRPQEDIYAEAFYCDTSEFKKAGKPTGETGNIRLYKAASVFLAVLCVLLLLATIALAVKLQNGSGVCPVPEDARSCSADECESVCATVQPRFDSRSGHICYQCPPGWLKFQERCFYLSTTRLSWELGQKNCSASGGSLAVIDSKAIQDFLTQKGNLNYWIGLKHDSAWTWVDKTVLRRSYWADNTQAKGCATLRSEEPAEKNWKSGSCSMYTYFICQLQM
ncbi:hepatic lectin isoform X2 [Nelusetta ayraudi]|uniref:hepatic lectin isoform X2 n=1 Tax=Nelusetta ayraudi TaxID=303726 RepID=UPI003F70956B